MNPTNSSQGGGALEPNGTPSLPSQSSDTPSSSQSQQAAAQVLRTRIDALYENQAQSSTYERTHVDHPQPQADQWKAYHSAWQEYYQKYYSTYYSQQARTAPTGSHQTGVGPSANEGAVFGSAPGHSQSQSQTFAEEVTQDEALFDLRQKLLGKVHDRARTIRKSRHFVPIIAALAVVLIFTFLQYNRVIIASVSAYVSPGTIDPQNIVVDPTADISVSKDPRLVIPKINVDVPVVYGIGADHDSQMKAMAKGVAHFAIPGANSHPGEVGNTVLSGHSSNDLFDSGDYKFIFAQLEKLKIGDTIYAHYKGKRYTYVVTKTDVVKPTDVQALIYPTKKPVLTLITCTPLGTALNRLLVTAEQVSPDPAEAAAAPSGSGSPSARDEAAMPGNAPTLLERLFGAR